MNTQEIASRINVLLDLLMQLAAGNLTARGEQSDRGDAIDALTCGFNMLAEEMQKKLDETRLLTQELINEKDKVIQAQAQAVRELSTPIIPVIEGILILPLIGTLDSTRAVQISESLLQAVTAHKATVVIVDITGVPVVDTKVASHVVTKGSLQSSIDFALRLTERQIIDRPPRTRSKPRSSR